MLSSISWSCAQRSAVILEVDRPGVRDNCRSLWREPEQPYALVRENTVRNLRWCSDGFELGCDSGEKVRVAFALDCCDREAMGFVATTEGYQKR